MTRHPTTGPPDHQTVSRALLTHCIDSADALMFATMKGSGGATEVARLLCAIHAGDTGRDDLERLFARGLVRWGRRVTPSAIQAFRKALVCWLTRLDTLPCLDTEPLGDHFTNHGTLWIIAPHSPWWPTQLDDLSIRKDWAPPLCLWGRGDVDALVSCPHPVAIVGSRGCDDYGREVARELGRSAADAGHLVVSGGAMGTDAAAHWGAIEAMGQRFDDASRRRCGRTIAVFAGGLDHIGPRVNDRLFARILEHGGALVSELCPDAIPEPRRFLLRNRIIAALATTIVVTQARRRSGALNTANWAADLGRDVHAVPGDITAPRNAGCNRLIHESKATILCTTEAIDDICHAPHDALTPLDDTAPSLHDAEPPPLGTTSPLLDTTSPSLGTAPQAHEVVSPPHGNGVPPPPTDMTSRHRDAPGDGGACASPATVAPATVAPATSPAPVFPEPVSAAAVLDALRRCGARSRGAGADEVLAALQEGIGHDTPRVTIRDLMGVLGLMELDGTIRFERGRITPCP